MATSQNGASKAGDTKFLHFREIDDRGNVNPRGGLTIAYRSIPRIEGFTGFEGSDSETYTEFAQAVCHENDNFVKALGRAKSGGRLQSSKFKSLFVGSERDFVRHAENVATLNGVSQISSSRSSTFSVSRCSPRYSN